MHSCLALLPQTVYEDFLALPDDGNTAVIVLCTDSMAGVAGAARCGDAYLVALVESRTQFTEPFGR